MKIKKVRYQNSLDFTATYECEYCTHQIKLSGCSNSFFHKNLTSEMKCESCGKIYYDIPNLLIKKSKMKEDKKLLEKEINMIDSIVDEFLK